MTTFLIVLIFVLFFGTALGAVGLLLMTDYQTRKGVSDVADSTRYRIGCRKKIEVNTDPQRRCYNGCHFSSEIVWGEWESFGRYTKEDGESSIRTFQSINPSHEYKLIPITEE